MTLPAIIWRNPLIIVHERLWSQTKRSATRSLYMVVQSGNGDQCVWENLPNLEVIEGGAPARAIVTRNRSDGTSTSNVS